MAANAAPMSRGIGMATPVVVRIAMMGGWSRGMTWMAGARRRAASRAWRPRAKDVVLATADVGGAVRLGRRFAREQHKGSGTKGGAPHGGKE